MSSRSFRRHCHPPLSFLLSPLLSMPNSMATGMSLCKTHLCILGGAESTEYKQASPLLCHGTLDPWREAVSLSASLYSGQSALSKWGAKNPSTLSSSASGDTPGCAKLIMLDSFKTALYECFKFLFNKGTNAL